MERIEDRIQYTDRGFSYIEVTPQEIFNWGGMCICNGCNNQFLHDNMYLSFVLTDTYCKDCWKGILRRQKHYSQEDVDYDLAIQKEQSLDWYKYYLDNSFRQEIIYKNTMENSNVVPLTDDEFLDFLKIIGEEEI